MAAEIQRPKVILYRRSGLGHSALFGFTGVLCIPFAFGHELGAFPAKRGARGRFAQPFDRLVPYCLEGR